MRILDRYILREIFYYFFILLAIFAIILVAKETYDTRDEILDQNPHAADVIQYVLLKLPDQLVDAIPLTGLFAVLFAIGLMAKNREITAMVSAGVTFNQLAVPVAIFGLLTTLGAFVLAEYVAPDALNRARYLFEVRVKGQNQFVFTSNDEIFRKGEGGRFYIMTSFDGARRIMTHPIILDRSPTRDGLSQRIEADRAVAIDSETGGEHYWEFQGTERWTFQDDGAVRVEKFTVPLRIKMEEKLDSFLSREKRPQEMRIGALKEFCGILERQGSRALLSKYATGLQAKFSLPIASLLLSLIGFAVAADLHSRRFVLAFSTGLAFGITYYLLREVLSGLGQRGLLAPVLAAWTSVVTYSLLLVLLMRRLSTVH